MRIKEMVAILLWLIKYAEKNRLADLERMKKEKKWPVLEKMTVEEWVDFYINTPKKIVSEVELLLIETKSLKLKERSNSNGLKKPVLRAIAKMMGIKEYNHKILRKDLENKIIRFVKNSA